MTREECEEKISGVCNGCGGVISAIKTVDNSGNPTYWAGCTDCSRLCQGIPHRHWRIARKIVEEKLIIPYPFIKEEDEGYLDSQTSGVADILPKIEHLLLTEL